MGQHPPEIGPESSDQPARRILAGRYVLEREIGHGGMATVFLAVDRQQRRQVAVKLLRPELTESISSERFLREIRITCTLVHPHILPLHDSGVDRGQLFYVMPYVEGETLRRRLDQEGPLSIDEAVDIARDVAGALNHAHTRGVVHRDVKPENILLSGGHAVVADFGIGHAAGDTLTTTGFVVGTPPYMSPEQALGGTHVDGRSDVYSLGCVLYEMLTGAPPFRGITPRAVIAQHQTAPPPEVRTIRHDASPALDRMVRRALAKEPADRFASAQEFADALAAARTGGRVNGPDERSRRRRLAAAGLLTGLTITLTALWYFARDLIAPPDEKLVAVAPFYVASADRALRTWEYALPALVADRLDLAEPLRAQSPASGTGRQLAVADRYSAAAFGRHAHAGYVVFAHVRAGRRRTAEVDAKVLDVRRARVIDELQVTSTDAADTWDAALSQVSDSLSRALLASFGARLPVAATQRAAFGCASSSWPAVMNYLRGEQFYRRTQWDSAIAAYRETIARDSGCALAYRRIAVAQSWRESDSDSTTLHYRLLAGAHNHGLSPRDSLLVTADSLSAAVNMLNDAPAAPASTFWAHVHRLLGTLEEASRRYPGDPEVWYALGDARYHWGWGPASTTPREILAAFDTAIQQDSGFAPSYLHPIELAFALGGRALAMRYVDGYLATEPTGVNADAVRLVAALADPYMTRAPEAARRLADASADVLTAARNLVDRWPDPAETAVLLGQVRAARLGVDTLLVARCRPGRQPATELAMRLAYRGHLSAAFCALGDSIGRGYAGNVLIELALLGGAPPDQVDQVYDTWLRTGKGYRNYSLPWWAARGDTERLGAFERRADSVLHRGADSAHRERASYDVQAARAYEALARADTTEALRHFAALPRARCRGCFDFDRLAEARLLIARESLRAAYRILQEWRGGAAVPSDVLIAYERARVAERLGERAAAAADYQTVVSTWARADSVLHPVVTDAQRALTRLRSSRHATRVAPR